MSLSSAVIPNNTFGWIIPASAFRCLLAVIVVFPMIIYRPGSLQLQCFDCRPYSPPSMSWPPRQSLFFLNFICGIRSLKQFFEFAIIPFPPYFRASVDASIFRKILFLKIFCLVSYTFLSGHVSEAHRVLYKSLYIVLQIFLNRLYVIKNIMEY